jgi:hypothetical protein
MYVDVLQEDRRRITKPNTFNKHGVLESLTIDPAKNTVSAKMCLPEMRIKYWPKKIAEIESTLRWINSESTTKFLIDYRSSAGI